MRQSLLSARRRRLLASDDVIHIDVWITLTPGPAANYTPPMMWSYVASPDPRMGNVTGRHGLPMSVTFSNATMYKVRPESGENAFFLTCLQLNMFLHHREAATKTVRLYIIQRRLDSFSSLL